MEAMVLGAEVFGLCIYIFYLSKSAANVKSSTCFSSVLWFGVTGLHFTGPKDNRMAGFPHCIASVYVAYVAAFTISYFLGLVHTTNRMARQYFPVPSSFRQFLLA